MLFYESSEEAPGSQAIQDALGVLEGKALFDGLEHRVHVRTAEHDGRIFLDLGDPEWQAVAIAPGAVGRSSRIRRSGSSVRAGCCRCRLRLPAVRSSGAPPVPELRAPRTTSG